MGTEEYYEQHYGEWLAEMAEDLGGEIEWELTEEELETLMLLRAKNENLSR
jgi:sulfur relay (sulfurtransferase) DsrC/TusE family protein